MAGLVAKVIFNKILHENPGNSNGREDPYFETVPASRLSVKRTKKQRKALPPGLSREDERTLVKVKRRAYRLDMAFGECCGMKIGWGSLIAIVPAIGDVVDMLLTMMVIRTASEANLPTSIKAQMVLNVAFDFLIGLVPFLGDLMDIAFKANTRNAILLEDYLRQRGAENIRKQGLPPQDDPSLGENFDHDQVVDQQPIPQPQPSYQNTGMRGGWFGGLGTKEYDVEAQRPNGRERGRDSRRERERERGKEGGSRREGGSKHKSSKHGSSRHESERHKSSRHKSSGSKSGRVERTSR